MFFRSIFDLRFTFLLFVLLFSSVFGRLPCQQICLNYKYTIQTLGSGLELNSNMIVLQTVEIHMKFKSKCCFYWFGFIDAHIPRNDTLWFEDLARPIFYRLEIELTQVEFVNLLVYLLGNYINNNQDQVKLLEPTSAMWVLERWGSGVVRWKEGEGKRKQAEIFLICEFSLGC